MPINEYDDNFAEPGEGFGNDIISPDDDAAYEYDPLGGGQVVPLPGGSIRSGTPGGQVAPRSSSGRRDLTNDTRQVPFTGNRQEGYNTIDVPAQRIPTSPPSALPPASTPNGNLPGTSNPPPLPGNQPPPAPALPPPQPGAGLGGLNESPPSPSPEGVTASQSPQAGNEGEFEPIAEEGQVVNVYASWRIGLFRVSDGVRVGQNQQGYFLRLTSARGPVTPFREEVPASPPGTRVRLGFRYFDAMGNPQTINLVETGGGNTDARLESFQVGTSPTDGAEAEPARGAEPNPRGRGALPSPGAPPRPDRRPFPVGLPNPAPANAPDYAPSNSPADSPFPFPSPNPTQAPDSAPSPTPTPATVPAPGPIDAPRRVPPPPVPGLPGLDELCQFLRECLAPSLAETVRDAIINNVINEIIQQLFGGNCSLDTVCDLLRDLSDSWFAQERFELKRKNCEGKDRSVRVIGRRGEIVVGAMQAGFQYTQELIEEKLPCGFYNEPKLIQSGTTAIAREVSYVNVANEVREVELVIPGALPDGFRIYRQSGQFEEQAKFGAIQEGIFNQGPTVAVIGQQHWVWTRNTLIRLEPYRGRPRIVRIFLEPGIQWALYDTGLRFN